MKTAQGKEKLRFNIIDLLIILAVLACVAGIFMRYNIIGKLGSSSESDSVEISFVIRNIRMTSVDALKEGDVFYWKQNDMKVGELVSKTWDYAEVFIRDSDYTIHQTYNEEKYDVRGVLSATGSVTSDGFMLGGTQYVGPGKEMVLMSKNITVTVVITDIKTVE